MTDDILRIRDFNPTNTNYSKLDTNAFGGKKMWVNYEGRRKFVLQLPRMVAPFGVSEFADAATGKTKYYLNLSFNKKDDMKGIIKMFHDKLTQWDDKLVEDASNNTVAWFKKPANKLTKNVLKKNYTPLLVRFKDPNTLEYTGEYPDKVKLKIPFWDGKFAVEVFDENQNPVDMSYIKPGSEIIAVVKSSNVWISADKFGASLNAGVLQVFPPERLSGYSFLPDLEEQASTESPVQPSGEPSQPQSEPVGGGDSEGESAAGESAAEVTGESVGEVTGESAVVEEEQAEAESVPEVQPEEEDDVKIQSEEDEVVPEPPKEEPKKVAAKRLPPSRATGTAKKGKSALDTFAK